MWKEEEVSIKRAVEFFALREAWLGDGGKPVPRKEAQSRADICLQCPHNNSTLNVYELFASGVASQLRRTIEMKNDLKLTVEGEQHLHICDVCLCVLKLKIHVPIKLISNHIDKEILNELPNYCWQKVEINKLKTEQHD